MSDPDEGNCFEGIKNVNKETFAAEECNNTDFSVGYYVVVSFDCTFFSREGHKEKGWWLNYFFYGEIEEKMKMAQSLMSFFNDTEEAFVQHKPTKNK